MKFKQLNYNSRSIHYEDYEYEDPAYLTQRRIAWGIIMPFAIIVIMLSVPFAPLAFSLIENHLIGTDYIYQAFQALDLADPLGKLYIPILERFPALNPP